MVFKCSKPLILGEPYKYISIWILWPEKLEVFYENCEIGKKNTKDYESIHNAVRIFKGILKVIL